MTEVTVNITKEEYNNEERHAEILAKCLINYDLQKQNDIKKGDWIKIYITEEDRDIVIQAEKVDVSHGQAYVEDVYSNAYQIAACDKLPQTAQDILNGVVV